MNNLEDFSKQTTTFLEQPRPILVGGEWICPSHLKWLQTINPADGEVVGEYCVSGQKEIDRAVCSAREAFKHGEWSTIKPAQRSKLLWKVAELIDRHAQELAILETLDSGKLYRSALEGEVPAAAEAFRYFSGWCSKMEGKTLQTSIPNIDFHAYTKYEPVGVVGLLVPWNGPLVMAAWKLAPALAAGCTCILKPAQQTPLSTLKLGEFFEMAGFPPGVVNIVTGDAETGTSIVDHPGIDKIAFTGSSTTAKKIIAASSGNLKKVSLELGGKSPVIVFDDADTAQVIIGASEAIFSNSGQVCVAGSRLFIQKTKYEEILEGILKKATSLKLGSGFDPETEMGPLISENHRVYVDNLVRASISEGAEVICGGEKVSGMGFFYEPTIMAKIKNDMTVYRNEVFGPVLTVMPFEDEDEAVELANDTHFGLAGSIWTSDIARAHRMASSIRAGLIWINSHGIPDLSVPFGGYKQSGWGRENGWNSMENFTELKSVMVKL
ncbi:MAG: aldehyde dehydrogenase [SAR324 cluster bacterium]|nr:betaine-aldehyde dehydrogenase [Deltaproteobacteria bacterium]MDP7499931.1 aldehyde dehydrogenase [SAR324 cluster bacterium]HCP35169.1 betaine-aldehyde dehydrogenase [Deltaproteobacteria bacterium]|tara:strand:+ start:4789 stop:6273 length:1485 start_codon:yes stop_codon:yes gene_type:complete